MSGGHFNYEQYKISQIADDIDQLVRDNNNQERDEWGDTKGSNFSAETIAEFKKGIEILKQAYVYAQRIDWLISGDDGEDTFHERLKHDLGDEE
jgi:restriction endonuclease S subunit